MIIALIISLITCERISKFL